MADICSVPDEVLLYILALVSPYGDLKSCACVNKRWRLLCKRACVTRKKVFSRSVGENRLLWASGGGLESQIISKRYSHSAVYDDDSLAVFVFGGCTSTSTTFNDLWCLEATKRTWSRPMATGNYPSPKACATLVKAETNKLLLFGGWTHPSLYPLHQSWRLFNELHSYHIKEMRWTLVSPMTSVKPPTMAGHSATVHAKTMIVFGGLQKQRSSIGQFSSSNDVWSFFIDTQCWSQEDIPEPRPRPRYGQSQLYLDDNHLLIMGGCGGPSNIYNDVWLLIMEQPHWKWVQCTVKNMEHGAGHMWCHPACRVGNFAIVLGKNRQPKSSSNGAAHQSERWNVIPQLRRGLNRGYGAIRRPHPPQRSLSVESDPPQQPPQLHSRAASVDYPPAEEEDSTSEEVASEEDSEVVGLAVDPVEEARPHQVFRSSVTLNISSQVANTNNGPPLRTQPLASPRMQAFAVDNGGHPPSAKRKQIETRQRQLDSLKRMEERYKKMEDKEDEAAKQPQRPPPTHKCSCHRLAVYVLDISRAISCHEVEWMAFKSNTPPEAPEETILYSLVEGRGELIMFGGIQKDVASIANSGRAAGGGASSENDTVSNALHFLTPPCEVV